MKKLFTFCIFFIFNTQLFSFNFYENNQTLENLTNKYNILEQEIEKDDFYTKSNTNEILFEFAQTSFQLKKYEQAMNIYEGLLIEYENDNRLKLELGRTYIALKDFKSANEMFDEVLESNPPLQVVENIYKYKKALELFQEIEEDKQNKNFENKIKFSFFGSFGLGFDDDINSMPSEETLNEYLGDYAQYASFDDQLESRYYQLMANINMLYFIKHSNIGDSIFLNNSLFGYKQTFLDEQNVSSDYDVDFVSFSSTLNYIPVINARKDILKFELPLKFDKVVYGEEPLLDVYSLGFKASSGYFSFLDSSLFFNYKWKNYIQSEDQSNDSEQFSLTFQNSFNLNRNIFGLGLTFEDENLQRNQSDENQIEKYVYILSLDYKYKGLFSPKLDLSLNYDLKKNQFKDFLAQESYSETDNSRIDIYQSYKFSLNYNFSKKTILDLNYNFISNESNHKPVNYDKNIYSLNLSFLY